MPIACDPFRDGAACHFDAAQKGRAVVLASFLALLPCLPAHSQDALTSLGMQRAASSALQWEIREAGHPILGPIRFAFLKKPLATPVGGANVSSNVYVSCEQTTGKIAIELTNARAPDDPGGLAPRTMPRLTCNTVASTIDPKSAAEELEAHWVANELGDVMARGFWPSTLRACASIAIREEVVLPKGWSTDHARVAFEITPYARELDSIFMTCGEPSVYSAALAPAPARATPSLAPREIPAGNSEARWISARVSADGRTNVRAKASVRSPLVTRLYPGDIVLVKKAGSEWWRAKSAHGAPFEGYIRGDRLVFE